MHRSSEICLKRNTIWSEKVIVDMRSKRTVLVRIYVFWQVAFRVQCPMKTAAGDQYTRPRQLIIQIFGEMLQVQTTVNTVVAAAAATYQYNKYQLGVLYRRS